VDGVGGGRDAEHCRREVERHAIDRGGIGAAAELVEFLATRYREDTDDGASF